MELLGERLELYRDLSIELLDRSTRNDKSVFEKEMKIKEGIDLLMKREPEGMKVFSCWTCNEFGNFSSTFPKRVRKSRKSSFYDED